MCVLEALVVEDGGCVVFGGCGGVEVDEGVE